MCDLFVSPLPYWICVQMAEITLWHCLSFAQLRAAATRGAKKRIKKKKKFRKMHIIMIKTFEELVKACCCYYYYCYYRATVGEHHREKEVCLEDTYLAPISSHAGRQLCC